MPPVAKTGGLNNLWLMTMIFLFYVFMTLYCTPYTALIPELGRSQKDKINISTYISITFILGTALSYGAPFIWDMFIAGGMERTAAMQRTFMILAVIALIFMWIPALLIDERSYVHSVPSKSKAFESLLKTFHNKYFRIFVLSDALYWIALTIFQTGLPFFVVRLLGLEEGMITVLFLLMTFTSFLFYMPVNLLAKRLGKKKLVITAFFLFALAFLFTGLGGLLPLSGKVHGYLIAILAAVPMAILGILPQAMVADIAQYDREKTSESREGMFFAARTFVFKLGQSVAMVLFTSLATIGQDTGLGYRLGLLGALVLSLLGAVVLFFYKEEDILLGIQALEKEA
jgi:GPH family glycoside/pentoside/hexuronide:cation symporter